jgi:NADH-quinone oxidoreductase subunit C
MSDKPFDEALEGLETGAAAEEEGARPLGTEADAATHASVGPLRERFGGAVLHHTVMAGDEHVVYVGAERIVDVLRWLRDDAAQRYDLLLDLTAVDYGGGRPLEVIYQLWSTGHRRQLRLKLTLPLTDLEVDSVCDVFSSADWMERETFDMFGIHFRGHPDLRRILMPDNYAEGHPLRKDFPLRGRFSRAEQTRRALAMAVEDFYTPEELTFGRAAPAAAAEGGAAPAGETEGTPGRPNTAEGWAQGAAGSAAPGVPGPGTAGSEGAAS